MLPVHRIDPGSVRRHRGAGHRDLPAAGTSYSIATSLTVQPQDPGNAVVLEGNGNAVVRIGSGVTVTLSGLTVEDGQDAPPVSGGGVDNAGTLTLDHVTVTNNTGFGGVLSTGALTVVDSTVMQNHANSLAAENEKAPVAGGITNEGGSLSVEDSTIAGNATIDLGDGLFTAGVATTGSTTIAESTLAGNGGFAVSALSGSSTVEATTFAGNTAGAIVADASSSVTLAADILGDRPMFAECSLASGAAPMLDDGFNADDDGSCGFTSQHGSLSDVPLSSYLSPLGTNGGPTTTVALLAMSTGGANGPNPAQLAIPATFALPVPVNGTSLACSLPDQRGTTRGAPCDMGAFALSAADSPPADTPEVSAIVLLPLGAVLLYAVAIALRRARTRRDRVDRRIVEEPIGA